RSPPLDYFSRRAPLRADPAVACREGATREKFYHTAFAGCGYRESPESRDPSSTESIARPPVSGPAPLPAPDTRQTDSARPPAAPSLAPPQSDRSAPRTAAYRQSRTKAALPARPLPARNSPSRTTPHSASIGTGQAAPYAAPSPATTMETQPARTLAGAPPSSARSW